MSKKNTKPPVKKAAAKAKPNHHNGSKTRGKKNPRQLVLAGVGLAVLVICTTAVMVNDARQKAERLALRKPLNPNQVRSASVALPLLGYWKLDTIEYQDESVSTPTGIDSYTADFANNGFVQISTGCVRAMGSYEVDGSGIMIEAAVAGENTCDEGALGARFIDAMNQAEWYTFKDGKLVINMKSNKGRLVLVKQN